MYRGTTSERPGTRIGRINKTKMTFLNGKLKVDKEYPVSVVKTIVRKIVPKETIVLFQKVSARFIFCETLFRFQTSR